MNDDKLICIEGKYLMQKQTGVQRYTYEILSALDKIISESDLIFELVIPVNAVIIPVYENIKVVKYGHSRINSRFWLQTSFARYVRKRKAVALCLGNEMPFFYKNSIVQLHDINAITYVKKEKVMLKYYYYYCAIHIKKYAGHILTVSKKSRYDIHSQFDVDAERMSIIPCSYEHVHKIVPSTNAIEKYGLEEKKFFFSVGSPYQPTKNLRWICMEAENYPNQLFVISGRKDRKNRENPIKYNIPSNVYLIGYASDAEIVELMMKCKAFVFPSLAEGFGIPPMEALAVGAKVIVSDISPLNDIYSESVHYIDPLEYNCNLDELIAEPVASKDACLRRFSWDISARCLLVSVENYILKMNCRE